MKAAWMLMATLCVLAIRVSKPTELVKSAKVSLGEAVEKAVPEVKDGAPISARIVEQEGKLLYKISFACGSQSMDVSVDAKTAELVGKAQVKKDRSKVAAASTLSMARAIEGALAKVPGKAVRTTFGLKKGKGIVEVKVVKDGKLFEVKLDGSSGAVIKVEQDDDDNDADDDDDDEDDDD